MSPLRKIHSAIHESWFYKYIGKPIKDSPYAIKEYLRTFSDNSPPFTESGKYLVAIPCGKLGKPYVEAIVKAFGHEHFDYIFFVYDDARFDEALFQNCQVVYEKGIIWYFAKKYLTPEFCENYDYIFFWDDDIEVDGFNPMNFLEIMRRNQLSFAQPSLAPNDKYSHAMTLSSPKCKVGRYTDFVEVMVPVYRRDAWTLWWDMLEADWNYWGWGYDQIFKSLKRIRKIGIVDCESVTHARAPQSTGLEIADEERNRLHEKYKDAIRSKHYSLRELK